MSEKTDTGTRTIIKDKESHFTLIKRSIHEARSDRSEKISTQIHKDGWQFKPYTLST